MKNRTIARSKQSLWEEIADKNRELAQVKRDLAMAIEQRDKLSAQVRNLTAEKQQHDSRWRDAGGTIGALKQQRAATLQALARVLADLAATPERQDRPYVTVVSSAPKDPAPF